MGEGAQRAGEGMGEGATRHCEGGTTEAIQLICHPEFSSGSVLKWIPKRVRNDKTRHCERERSERVAIQKNYCHPEFSSGSIFK